MAVAERQIDILARHRRLVANAVDLKLLLIALRHADDEIVDLRPRGAPHGARPLGFIARRNLDQVAFHRHRNFRRHSEFQLAFGALDRDMLPVNLSRDARRDGDWFLADTRHGVFLFPSGQNTLQSTSPPTFCSRAEWSAMTPLGVETMVMPRPLLTRGMASTAQ